MKLAILKGGTNITFNDSLSTAAVADIVYVLRQLEIDDHEITIVTHKTRNTFIPKRLKFKEIRDKINFDEFDAVLVFNFSINFFGGVEDLSMIAMYKGLAETFTPIIIINTDGNLSFKQLWPSIWKRDWAKKYAEHLFYIDPDNVFYISQGHNPGKTYAKLTEKPDYIQIDPSHLHYFPLAMTIFAKHEKYVKKNPIPFHDRKYDLGYGGATRNTHRRKRIEHYYTGEHWETLLFGNLRGVNTGRCAVRGKVQYSQFIKQYYEFRSTITVGDLYYNNNFFTLRMYESLLADCIVYIDQQMDPSHLFYGDDADRFYVRSPLEINPDLHYMEWSGHRRRIIGQYNFESYRKLLVEIIDQCVRT